MEKSRRVNTRNEEPSSKSNCRQFGEYNTCKYSFNDKYKNGNKRCVCESIMIHT